MAWIDNHCHLRADDHDTIVEARAAGVTRMITVGTDLEHSRIAAAVAAANDGVWATAGVHPHDATQGLDGIVALLDQPKVVAVGEAGLDYYYDHSPRDVQQVIFAAQIALAQARDLPLVIHTRDAWDDTFRILDREGIPRRTVFHCFTGGPDEASAALARGAYLSISGIVTFKTAHEVRAAVASAPLDRLLVETDSPYLAPIPHRGQPNRPAWVPLVGAAVAVLKDRPVAEIEALTWQNASVFYGLDPVGA
jgi:TatD DNase family protein